MRVQTTFAPGINPWALIPQSTYRPCSQDDVIRIIQEVGEVDLGYVSRKLDCCSAVVSKTLQRLVDMGCLSRTGERGNYRYAYAKAPVRRSSRHKTMIIEYLTAHPIATTGELRAFLGAKSKINETLHLLRDAGQVVCIGAIGRSHRWSLA